MKSLFLNLNVKSNETISISIYPYPQNNEECGHLLLDIIRNNEELIENLSNTISIVKSVFPTRYNQNKFMLGMGIERLFTEIICVHSTRMLKTIFFLR